MQKSNNNHHQPPYYWTTTTTTTSQQHHHLDQNVYFADGDGDGDVSQGSQQFSSSDHTLPNNSFSSNGSPNSLHSFQPEPLYHSPDDYTSHLNMDHHLQNTIKELETIIGNDQVFSSSNWGDTDADAAGFDTYNVIPADEECSIMEEIISRGDLKEALLACAKAVAQNNTPIAEKLISMLRPFVSVSGDPSQRLAAYMLEGLVARLYASGTSIYKSLKCKEPTGGELFSYMMLLYEACPYFKFGYLSANGAIAEATKNEDSIHIIDFQISQGGQWVTLIQALAARPGGPPRLRITGIDDSRNAFARGGGLNIVGQRLAKLAESCKVPFEFYGVPVSGSDIEIQHLRVQPGEALAVNCALVLHHLPDETVHPQNHRDRLIRLIKSLSPKVVTLVEQESDVNTTNFFPRFQEAFSYYSAMFDSIDATLPRDHKERINVEQHCLAGEIVNVLACEGTEREERHELLGMWRSRFAKAGFTPFPLSTYVNATIKTLLENYCDKYRLEERDGALFLGWMNRDLVSSSAWK